MNNEYDGTIFSEKKQVGVDRPAFVLRGRVEKNVDDERGRMPGPKE